MKLLHVIPSVGPKRGGPSFAVRAMVQTAAQKGFEVHIATTDDNGDELLAVPLSQPVIDDGIIYHYFHRQTKFYTFSSSLTRWLIQNISEFDLVHIHSLFSYSTLPAAWLAHWYHIPYIVRPLGHLNRWGIKNRRAIVKKFSLNIIERPILNRATLLHFTSEQERLEAKDVGVNGLSIVLPLGIDLKSYDPLPSSAQFLKKFPFLQGKLILLFLSRIDSKKGIELLLTAFAKLRRHYENLALVLAGHGESNYLAQLRSFAQELEIESDIVWPGFLEGREKLSAFASASIFVLPSYSENFGIAVVEAMAAGLPVVISDQVGIHREVARYEAGVITSCNVGALTKALESLICDPSNIQQIGLNAKNISTTLFSQQAVTERLLALYENIRQIDRSKDLYPFVNHGNL